SGTGVRIDLDTAHHVVTGRADFHRFLGDVDLGQLHELVVHRRQPALISSAGSRDAMSRKTPPCGELRPAFTSELMARAPSSRGSRSGVRRAESLSLSHRSASSMVSAYWPLNTGGMYSNMNLVPSEFFSTPPSPRTPSVTRMPFTLGGQTMPVGWNWTNSMLISVAPARSASAWPSPVYSHEFDVTLYDLPIPPVAITTAGASNRINRP